MEIDIGYLGLGVMSEIVWRAGCLWMIIERTRVRDIACICTKPAVSCKSMQLVRIR